MVNHVPTSITIEYDIQDNDSTLDSKNESHKITVFTPHKKKYFFTIR